jgi:DNA-binding transcriptional MerR regulator
MLYNIFSHHKKWLGWLKVVGMEMLLAELAERSGVPARTIRLYISQGILDPPLRAGRQAAYGDEHLARLRQIRQLQREGLTLADIRVRFAAPGDAAEVKLPEAWAAYHLSPDVTVMVKSDAAPWRLRRVRKALAAFAKQIEIIAKGEDENGDF